ncbi:MAG: T9SS type A sorting domain-containing protein [Flavobacteriales bacterium]|nr:T9SS type A sorting domain-containing protein [Flavobacteriales bacterium]
MTLSLPPHFVLASFTVLTSLGATAQDFAPFTSESRKLFATAAHDRVFSLAFDSTASSGDTAFYYNFHTKRDTLLPSNCGWWTGQVCWPMDQPTWAGEEIKVAPNGTHIFHSAFEYDDPVTLEFSTVPGSETFMASSIDQEFLMAYDGTFTMDILGQTEEVRQWTILHQDQFGNAIASPLNGAHIRVGENLGLLDFFRVDSFPLILEPISLVGQFEPQLGLHEVTPAVLEDHQPGDEVQFHETYDLHIGPPCADYDRYRKYVYLSRQDTPTEVTYSVHQEVFNADGTGLVVDTVTLTFDRTTILGTIPFEQFNGAWPHLHEASYCGMPLWTLTQPLHNGIDYCADENCWGGTDTGGPPVEGANTYVVGLGTFDRVEFVSGMPGHTLHYSMVYFKKNGTECFQEVMMGSEQAGAAVPSFLFSPNPTTGLVRISSRRPVTSAEVIDAQGHLVTATALNAARSELDLGTSAEGLYLVRLRFVDGCVVTERVLLRR